MPNPFRREQDAFRMLVGFILGAAIVIAVTLVSGSSLAGLIVAAVLLAAAALKLWLDYRRSEEADEEEAQERREPDSGAI